ncbi:MAG TPA: HIT domain-containing protein [Rudaea sp.]|nr:HIT domain-containing protein [Rudaea sp.]
MNAFTLDAQLAADTHAIGDFALSRVLLMDDARYAWLILVPRREGMRELTDLSAADRHLLTDEIDRAARALAALERPDKLNVAALGNVVAQLHVHVVARRRGDAAWPRPVWGVGEREPYAADARAVRLAALREALAFGHTA